MNQIQFTNNRINHKYSHKHNTENPYEQGQPIVPHHKNAYVQTFSSSRFLVFSIFIAGLMYLMTNSCKKSDDKEVPLSAPVLTTNEVIQITPTTALCGGNITYNGGSAVVQRGVCWSTKTDPTIKDSISKDGIGDSIYTSEITGLKPGTNYYVRAYATNSVGTGYGKTLTFLTTDAAIGIETKDISNIMATTAICGGNVTFDGGCTVTQKGVCYSTDDNPTIDDFITNDGTGAGAYVSNLTGLINNVTYYIRAYAKNCGGTVYGTKKSFKTQTGIAVVSLNPVSSVLIHTATSSYQLISTGGTTVSNSGICWSTQMNPTISSVYKTVLGSTLGTYSSKIGDLTPNTDYYIRAYVTTTGGNVFYSDNRTFKTVAATVSDYENNGYTAIEIGNQIWMGENLRSTKYNNGTAITQVTDNALWSGTTISAYCYYANQSAYSVVYGILYNWYTINNGNLCPTGWHVPTIEEWDTLALDLGNDAGYKLKTTGDAFWSTTSASVSNSSGFSARGGGYRLPDGQFLDVTVYGYWWSSSNFSTASAWSFLLKDTYAAPMYYSKDKNNGYSVRCIRN
jgi:uncharacterized protein (TIGR02145 family)